MTPSQWHDDASGRDAGHDEMQIAVFDYLRDTPSGRLPLRECEGCTRVAVRFEHPFVQRGKVIAWGDVVEIWDEEKELYPKRTYVVWEIKPKIYSVGAVVRQCVALKIAAKAATLDRNGRQSETLVVPIVRFDDPKISALRHVFCAAAWDGESLA
jgi:hypothetical protein